MLDLDLGNLLAAMGNHEAKALLLVAMHEGVVYSASALHRLSLDRQGQLAAWRPASMTPFDYCKHSLAPIGLVAEEVVDAARGTYGYIKTRYGAEFGDALAGHLLTFSEADNVSLLQLFGNTNTTAHPPDDAETVTSAKRAPYRRFRLFAALLRAALPVQQLVLMRELDESHTTLGSHLRNLARHGIVSYQTKHLGDSYVFYQLRPNGPPGPSPPDPRNRVLTDQVLGVLRSQAAAVVTRDQVYATLVDMHMPRRSENVRGLKASISKVLSHLERAGVVERGRFKPAIQSEVDLTSEQRARLTDLVNLCTSVARSEPSFLADGRAKAAAIVNDPMRVRALLQKVREVSPATNRTDTNALAEMILSALHQRPCSSVSELRDDLAKQYDKDITSDRVRQIIALLRTQGAVTVTSDQRPRRYATAAPVPTG